MRPVTFSAAEVRYSAVNRNCTFQTQGPPNWHRQLSGIIREISTIQSAFTFYSHLKSDRLSYFILLYYWLLICLLAGNNVEWIKEQLIHRKVRYSAETAVFSRKVLRMQPHWHRQLSRIMSGICSIHADLTIYSLLKSDRVFYYITILRTTDLLVSRDNIEYKDHPQR